MARQTKITKEAIIETAFTLVRKEGFESLNARNLASAANCSTQPIYSQFENMEKLRDLLLVKGYLLMVNDYMTAQPHEDSFLKMGLGYVAFAAKDPQLFRGLFVEKLVTKDLWKEIEGSTHLIMMDRVAQGAGLENSSPDALNTVYQLISIFTHGLAMRALNHPEYYTDEKIKELLCLAAESFMSQSK